MWGKIDKETCCVCSTLIVNTLDFLMRIYTYSSEDMDYLPTRAINHSCWQRGHLLLCLIHKLMQHWWKLWLHSPQTTTQSLEAEDSLESALDSAWHLKQASITCTRQMAHVSHSTSQLHIATAFHFLRENNFPEDAESSVFSSPCCMLDGWDDGVDLAIFLKENMQIHW